MTKESAAVMPEIMASSMQPQAKQAQTMPVAVPPKAVAAPQSSAPMGMQQALPVVEDQKRPIEKGTFPMKIIASIQQIYAAEQQKQDRLQGNLAQNMALKPGWGGQ
jgi:hypothetical protein